MHNQTHQARTQLTQIFRYIQAFNLLQNPIERDIEKQSWLLWLNSLPIHPSVRRSSHDTGDAITSLSPGNQRGKSANRAVTEVDNSDAILKVRRPTLTDPPMPPGEIAPWLQHGWQDAERKITLDPQGLESIRKDPRKASLLRQWTVARDQWAEKELPACRAMHIFNQLYALHAQLGREAERVELMLGDGIIDWKPNGSDVGIYHPMLVLRLQLHFDAQIPEFTLSVTEHPSELSTSLLQSLTEVNTISLGHIRQDFEENHVSPLEDNETSQFLQRLVYQLSPRGAFSDQARERTNRPFPLITRNPVLFLRSRTLGYNTAFESILEDLPQRTDLPYSLLSLTGINATNSREHHHDPPPSLLSSPNGEDEHILFSKPANAEQLDIAKRLERFGAVLVQGPPGTGKTHTIANLVGHLLAQGKSVLVTSHTSKALKVLREKVVEPLQPLCVSILEDDSRKEMERAIDTITERLSFTNAGTLEREAAKLTQQRIDLLATLQHTRGQLKEARQSEYREIVLNGRTYTPSEAARYVAQQSAACDWLPAPLIPDTPLLLSPQELASLYQTNVTVTGQDEREMAVGLPDPQKLASPVDVEQWAAEREHLLQEHLDFRPDLWITAPDHVPVEELKQLEHRLVQALEPLKENGDDRRWRLAVIADGRQGGVARQVWDDLITKIKQVENLALQAQPLSLEYDLVLPDSLVSSHTEQVLSEILKQVERSGHLNGLALLLHRDWKTLLEQAQVNGQRPETREHFLALLMYIRLMIARKDLAGRWQRQMAVLGAPDAAQLGSAPERICRQYLHQLHQCLHWFPEIWEPLEQELRHQGLQWDTVLAEMPVNLAEHGELLRLCDAVQERLPPMLAAEKSRRLYQANEARFHDLQCLLELHNSNHASADVVQRLHSAVSNHDAKAYREAFMRLVDLYEKQHALRQRQDLLSKLEQCAPGWANAIHHREGIHGEHVLPGDPQEAWHWRQLQEALECRSSASLAALQERCIQLSDHLHRMTAELVEKKAWAAQVCRTTPVQRRALQGWKELMRKVGKGTGKRAATLLAEARRLMPECQTAVPVWIMPLSRVVQNFDPRTNRFDVVIIDEASQADIKALAAIYMGHQIVVVGDDEQVTPVDVGQKLEQVDKLMNEHLQNIPLAKLYDGRLSIYALAKTASFELVYLQEHFRCVAPIIRFSNVLSYEGKIKPLRDDSDVKRRPATVAYRVQAFESNGQTNEPEAQAITSLLIAATEQPEYRDATFGVISMVSDRQALHIESLLRQYLPIAEYTRRHILCGNPAHFQGDERDIIFLSMVDTPKGDGPLPFRSEDAFEYLYKKRFNVAASRARDQLWVVHSLDPRVDLKDGDIRKRLILHAQNPTYALSKLAEQEQRAESEFEKQVLRRLTQAGYRVISQWPVGAYRLDLVVEDNGRRLAVECDGDRWHPIEKLEEDVARQIVLERLGWRFARIRGSHFFRNPEQALAPVFARLRELDIAPMSNGTMEHASSQGETELYKRITHRAAELRMQWSAPTKRPAVSTRAASMINRPS